MQVMRPNPRPWLSFRHELYVGVTLDNNPRTPDYAHSFNYQRSHVQVTSGELALVVTGDFATKSQKCPGKVYILSHNTGISFFIQ